MSQRRRRWGGWAAIWSLVVLCTLASEAVAGAGAGARPRAQTRTAAIRVLTNAHRVTFGQEMRFSLDLEGDAPITSIALAYRTSDTQGTTVETIAFAPDKALHVEYVHRIEDRYVRPYVRVSYWWTILDLMGARLVTDPQQFLYTDDRFQWQELSQDGVNLHWYQGELKVAQQALDATVAGLGAAEEALGTPRPTEGAPVEVFLYANARDWVPALPPGTPPDVEALTLHEMNVVLTSFGPETAYIPDLKRVLAHEAAHVYVHAIAPNAPVPLWLNEGLATSVQFSVAPDPEARTLLEQAARDEALIPLLSLCVSFPQDTAQARLAYVQSASAIDLIRDRYGRHRLRQLFDAYGDGATCEGGIYRVLGVSLEGLEAQWRAGLTHNDPSDRWWVSFWRRNGAYLVLIGVLALPTLFVLLTHWRRRAAQAVVR